ncbi:MAG: HDIG domain-containing protein [Methanoregulaceae archaeon]|nr:HDIG domain-containing protein [Methanoregulaceae archaeon]MDD5684544.1 HDIG domain-containing protein [Methanoregulaceae archaeon]
MPDPPGPSYEALLSFAGCSPAVIRHCKAVTSLADEYAKRTGIADLSLVHEGAMLHDIGRGATHSIRHAQEGARICRDLGLPEEIVLLVERHIGAGMTADECSLAGLLPIDCVPKTLEEKIVANADNLVRGTTPVSIYNRLNRSYFLPRKVRRRIFRLWIEMEQYP